MFPYGETVTRKRGQKVSDGYGGEVIDWSLPTDDITFRAAMAPRTEGDITSAGRAGVVVGYTLYYPFGVDVGFEDRIDTQYGLFEIDGEPGPWRQPDTGWEAGATAALRRVVG